jgi:hypothetical protein
VTQLEEKQLIVDAAHEQKRAGDWKIQFSLDLNTTLALIGNLQLALRHPANQSGTSYEVARDLIDDIHTGLKERGFHAHARMIEFGDDPAHDFNPEPARARIATVQQKSKPS